MGSLEALVAFLIVLNAEEVCEKRNWTAGIEAIFRTTSPGFREVAEIYNKSQEYFVLRDWARGLRLMKDPAALLAKLNTARPEEKKLAQSLLYNRGIAFYKLKKFRDAYESFLDASAYGSDADLMHNLEVSRRALESEFQNKLKQLSKIPGLPGEQGFLEDEAEASTSLTTTNMSGLKAKTLGINSSEIDWKKVLDGLDGTRNPEAENIVLASAKEIEQLERDLENLRSHSPEKTEAAKFDSQFAAQTFKEAEGWSKIFSGVDDGESDGGLFSGLKSALGFGSVDDEDEHRTGTEVRSRNTRAIFSRIWVSPNAPQYLFAETFNRYDSAKQVWSRDYKRMDIPLSEKASTAQKVSVVVELKDSRRSFRLPQSPQRYIIDPQSLRLSSKQSVRISLRQESDGTIKLRSSGEIPAGTRVSYDLLPQPSKPMNPPTTVERQTVHLSEKYLDKIKQELGHSTDSSDFPKKLSAHFYAKGIYTTDDADLDDYLKNGPGSKYERLIKIYLQEDLPPEIRGKGMDCDCWAELSVHTLRALGVPARLVGGYLRDSSQVIDPLENHHGWFQAWNAKKSQWEDFDSTPQSAPTAEMKKLAARIRELKRIKTQAEAAIRMVDLVNDPAVTAMKFRDVLWSRELGWQNSFDELSRGLKSGEPMTLSQYDGAKSALLVALEREIFSTPAAIQQAPVEIRREFLMHELALIEWFAPRLGETDGLRVSRLIDEAHRQMFALNDGKPIERLLKITKSNGPHRLLLDSRTDSLYLERGHQFSWHKVVQRKVPLGPRRDDLSSQNLALSSDGKTWAWLTGQHLPDSTFQWLLLKSGSSPLELRRIFPVTKNNFGKTPMDAFSLPSFEGNFQGFILGDWKLIDGDSKFERQYKFFDLNGRTIRTQILQIPVTSQVANFFAYEDAQRNLFSFDSGGQLNSDGSARVFLNGNSSPIQNPSWGRILPVDFPDAMSDSGVTPGFSFVGPGAQKLATPPRVWQKVEPSDPNTPKFALKDQWYDMSPLKLGGGVEYRFSFTRELAKIGSHPATKRFIVRLNGTTIHDGFMNPIRPELGADTAAFSLGDKNFVLVREENVEKRAADLVYELLLPEADFLAKAYPLIASQTLDSKEWNFLWRNFLHHQTGDKAHISSLDPIAQFLHFNIENLTIDEFSTDEQLSILTYLIDQTDLPAARVAALVIRWGRGRDILKVLSEPARNGLSAVEPQRRVEIIDLLRPRRDY